MTIERMIQEYASGEEERFIGSVRKELAKEGFGTYVEAYKSALSQETYAKEQGLSAKEKELEQLKSKLTLSGSISRSLKYALSRGYRKKIKSGIEKTQSAIKSEIEKTQLSIEAEKKEIQGLMEMPYGEETKKAIHEKVEKKIKDTIKRGKQERESKLASILGAAPMMLKEGDCPEDYLRIKYTFDVSCPCPEESWAALPHCTIPSAYYIPKKAIPTTALSGGTSLSLFVKRKAIDEIMDPEKFCEQIEGQKEIEAEVGRGYYGIKWIWFTTEEGGKCCKDAEVYMSVYPMKATTEDIRKELILPSGFEEKLKEERGATLKRELTMHKGYTLGENVFVSRWSSRTQYEIVSFGSSSWGEIALIKPIGGKEDECFIEGLHDLSYKP